MLRETSRRLLNLPARLKTAVGYHRRTVCHIAHWLVNSREATNFTYELTARNVGHLAEAVCIVTGRSRGEIDGYLAEPNGDAELADHIRARTAASASRHEADERGRFARRLGWYAVVRALKPGIVVETGVEKGLGAVILCSALRRNAAEGRHGRYFGTDIAPGAGYLLGPPYDAFGSILFGDSIASLERLDESIGVFVNDSDHSPEYEYQEYVTIRDRLAAGAVILGDNAHVTDSLLRFSRETGRRFLFFKEEPKDHWYPGAGIGFSY